jgi:hypothetical protein
MRMINIPISEKKLESAPSKRNSDSGEPGTYKKQPSESRRIGIRDTIPSVDNWAKDINSSITILDRQTEIETNI